MPGRRLFRILSISNSPASYRERGRRSNPSCLSRGCAAKLERTRMKISMQMCLLTLRQAGEWKGDVHNGDVMKRSAIICDRDNSWKPPIELCMIDAHAVTIRGMSLNRTETEAYCRSTCGIPMETRQEAAGVLKIGIAAYTQKLDCTASNNVNIQFYLPFHLRERPSHSERPLLYYSQLKRIADTQPVLFDLFFFLLTWFGLAYCKVKQTTTNGIDST